MTNGSKWFRPTVTGSILILTLCIVFSSFLSSTLHLLVFMDNNNKNASDTASLSENNNSYAISIVYFTGINANNEKWKDIIREQLGELVSSGLAQEARSISVVLSSQADSLFNDTAEVSLYEAELLVKSIPVIGQKAVIFSHSGNQYEYRGMKQFWDQSFVSAAPVIPRNHIMLSFMGRACLILQNSTTGDPSQTRLLSPGRLSFRGFRWNRHSRKQAMSAH